MKNKLQYIMLGVGLTFVTLFLTFTLLQNIATAQPIEIDIASNIENEEIASPVVPPQIDTINIDLPVESGEPELADVQPIAEIETGVTVLEVVENLVQKQTMQFVSNDARWVAMHMEDYSLNRSNIPAPNGMPLDDQVTTQSWHYLEDGLYASKMLYRMMNLDGQIIQESAYVDGTLYTSTGQQEKIDPTQMAVSFDFGTLNYIERSLTESNTEITGYTSYDEAMSPLYVALVRHTYETPLRMIAQPEISIIANERRYQFNLETGELVQVEVISIGSDGSEVVTSRIRPVWQVVEAQELPKDVHMRLAN